MFFRKTKILMHTYINIIASIENCNIGNEGAKHLSKGRWPQLNQLTLCNPFFYQLDTNFVRTDGF